MRNSYDTEAFYKTLHQKGVRVSRIQTYAEFIEECDLFLFGAKHSGHKTYCLIICGNPGTSKSHYMQKHKDKANCFYRKVDASPVGLYKLAWKAKVVEEREGHSGIILDDVDTLFDNRAAVSILKAMCEPAPRHLSWTKQNKQLEAEGVPDCFAYKSRICIITNELPQYMTANLRALYDRANPLLVFEPTLGEVHQYVERYWPKLYPKDKDVLRFVERHIEYVPVASIRNYESVLDLKRKYPDWREKALRFLLEVGDKKKDVKEIERLKIMSEIQIDPKLKSDKERERVWQQRAKLCRAFYFEYKRKYLKLHGKEKC